MYTYKCKYCAEEIEVLDHQAFAECGEESLWGHIQMKHAGVFDQVEDMGTPDMLETCYEVEGDAAREGEP